MSQETNNYMHNYQLLKSAADELSKQEVPDVDKVIPLVQQGTEAYKHCMSRIEEVEKMLKDIESQTNASS